ncbi:NADH oxidase [Schleiferilactobacillus harbinensis]|uniref:FAD-dependent oxidoreductase n=1 Tax=Schleiferilactobacillus harbinensis TaxID=304207 RepID=UPI0021A609FB|nr:FAD-dependent oxidoreductase [Schleiferilactobacillus harbinensis]MCT2908504.1 NADH oxidase [Schleiferilactobacillus harbinensis]
MKVIIVGYTHAGVAAVRQIFQEYPDTEVTIYERDNNVSFLSCGIPLYLSGQVKRLEDMFYATPADLAALGAKVCIRHDVVKIDTAKKDLTIENLETHEIFHDTYDKLIMTTGSYVVVPPLMGIDHERVLLCKDYWQAQAIHDTAAQHRRIAVVGGGYVGVELTEAYAQTDHDVTLIQGHDQILNNYIDQEISGEITDLLTDHGVQIHLNERVQAFRADEKTGGLLIDTGDHAYAADLAIVCTGFMANTDLLRGQVTMDRHGAIITNDYQQNSDPDIYAARDACTVRCNPTGKPAYIPLATNAVRQGMIAARNLYGHKQKFLGTQGSTAMMLFGNTLATTGITLTNARKSGIDAAGVLYHANYRPDFMHPNTPVTIKLVYDRQDRRVLGAQLWSLHEVTQSANAISIAIQNRNTIDDLAYVDMLFQPHFDQPFNYLNQAAQMAVAQETAATTRHHAPAARKD